MQTWAIDALQAGIKPGVRGLDGVAPLRPLKAPTTSQKEIDSFATTLNNCLNYVNVSTSTSSVATDKFLTGELDGIHQMTLASAKKSVMIKLTTQVASKLATATSSVMQMQL